MADTTEKNGNFWSCHQKITMSSGLEQSAWGIKNFKDNCPIGPQFPKFNFSERRSHVPYMVSTINVIRWDFGFKQVTDKL